MIHISCSFSLFIIFETIFLLSVLFVLHSQCCFFLRDKFQTEFKFETKFNLVGYKETLLGYIFWCHLFSLASLNVLLYRAKINSVCRLHRNTVGRGCRIEALNQASIGCPCQHPFDSQLYPFFCLLVLHSGRTVLLDVLIYGLYWQKPA